MGLGAFVRRNLALQHVRPNLADPDSLLGQRGDAVDLIDVAAGVQTVAAFFSDGLDEAITAFPSAQGDRADASEFRYRSDGVHSFAGIFGHLCYCVHILVSRTRASLRSVISLIVPNLYVQGKDFKITRHYGLKNMYKNCTLYSSNEDLDVGLSPRVTDETHQARLSGSNAI